MVSKHGGDLTRHRNASGHIDQRQFARIPQVAANEELVIEQSLQAVYYLYRLQANHSRCASKTDMALPTFKYHPDPVATGHVIESGTECVCCGKVRGFIYTGPVYAVEEFVQEICPWCIADGSAHEKLDASFTDEVGIGGGGRWDEVPAEIVEEVAYRTPGFCGWQQEQWWTHCGDAAQFIGRVGRKELEALGRATMTAIQKSTGLSDGPEWDQFFSALDKQGSPRAYMFRCTKCGQMGGYQDCD